MDSKVRGQKKSFWLVTTVTFQSNLSNFEINPKNSKQIKNSTTNKIKSKKNIDLKKKQKKNS